VHRIPANDQALVLRRAKIKDAGQLPVDDADALPAAADGSAFAGLP